MLSKPVGGFPSSVVCSSRKQSLLFTVDLYRDQLRLPKIFSENYSFNPQNFFYLKLARENRRNDVAVEDCCHYMLPHAFRSDRLYSAKIGLKYNQFFSDYYPKVMDSVNCHASSKLTSNWAGLRHLKTHFFARRMYTFANGNL